MKIVTIRNFAAITLMVVFMAISNAKAADIAVLDVENIVKNSAVMKDVQNKVSKKQTEYQKEIDKRQTALEAEGKKLDSKKGILSEEAFNKEQAGFDKKIGDLKDYLEKRQNSLKKASFDAMAKVNDKIRDIIADISKEKKLQLVVPASQTLFYDNEIDISSEVLKRLNAKLTKVDVKFE
jgi:outer membrane protein